MSTEPPIADPPRESQPPSAPPTGVIGKLLTEGFRFSFFQAVRLLECWRPTRSPVGRDSDPGQESVHFGALPSSDFPASQIYDVSAPSKPDRPPRMTVTFFGMTGPLGALPRHYTELVLERIAKKDRTLLAFLDLFNHRLISLFYRAWEKYRFWISTVALASIPLARFSSRWSDWPPPPRGTAC
jgi:type VI secretion system protein ImpH